MGGQSDGIAVRVSAGVQSHLNRSHATIDHGTW